MWQDDQLEVLEEMPEAWRKSLGLWDFTDDGAARMALQWAQTAGFWAELTMHPRGYRLDLFLTTAQAPPPAIAAYAEKHEARVHPMMTMPLRRPAGAPVHTLETWFCEAAPAPESEWGLTETRHAGLRLGLLLWRLLHGDTP